MPRAFKRGFYFGVATLPLHSENNEITNGEIKIMKNKLYNIMQRVDYRLPCILNRHILKVFFLRLKNIKCHRNHGCKGYYWGSSNIEYTYQCLNCDEDFC